MDLRKEGEVRYETFTFGDGLFDTVNDFIRFHPNASIADSEFTGTWMLLVQWNEVHPYPHGSLPENATQSLRDFVSQVSC